MWIDLFAGAHDRRVAFPASRRRVSRALGHSGTMPNGWPCSTNCLRWQGQFPSRRYDFETIFARVAGAAYDAALPFGGGMQQFSPSAAVISHPLQIDVHQRLQDLQALGGLGWRTLPTAG